MALLDAVHAPVTEAGPRQLARLVKAALGMVWASARREFSGVMVAAVLGGAGSALQVYLTGRLVAGLTSAGTGLPAGLGVKICALAGVTIGLGFLASFQRERERVVGELVARHAQTQVLEVSAQVPMESFEEPAFYDRLQRAMVTAEIRPVQLASGLLSTLVATTGALGVAVGLLTISPLLGVLVPVAAVPLWLAAHHANRALYMFTFRMTHDDRTRAYVSDLMASKESAAEVRAFGLASFFRARFDRLYDARLAAVRDVAGIRLRASLAGGLGSGLVVGAVILLAVRLVATGSLSLPEAGTAIVAVALLAQRLAAATDGAARLHESTLFVEDFVTFVEPERARVRAVATAREPAGFDRIALRDVSFRYPAGSAEVLHEIDLDLRAGEVIALVGENGSGKTTLAKVLAGIYQPTRGTVSWDDVVLDEPRTRAAREQIAVAFQDFVRYRFPIAENITVGRPTRADDREAMIEAARRARADRFVEQLPEGYETQLGTQFLGGSDLSGGQWQRLALARAFFRDAPLIILDEPTSALDPRAERELFDDIRTLCAGRTVLLISHRFANVRSADRIHVMAAGRIAESGTHEELLDLGGRYAELFHLQASTYLDPKGEPWHPLQPS
ncbi:ABC transporter ATP-binding protein [Kribbella albertanoniae]|uniref:ABC transporter ATP-binding protein n=1 Tax=Kribbella albertanoniae TaxID=1266829 RepID=A0A4R4Q4B8_9ACTN|nr:ABC transporter ATP-binding protein [Kribbella albertanoniae]TDC29663.1 ABC transporter ATP-binding protein [Kribbella albertanoniae]